MTAVGPAEARRILDAIAGDKYEQLYAVTLALGLRQPEVLGLQWVDVDLDGGTLTVARTLQREAGAYRFEAPKTERSRRSVPIPPTLAAMLTTHRDEQDERKAIAGQAWAEGNFVFDRGDGRPIDPDSFGRAFRDARDAAGLEDVRLHDLRHAYATLQIAEGTDARLVSDLLGHATVAFTLMTYVHPDEDAATSAAETAERMLSAAVVD